MDMDELMNELLLKLRREFDNYYADFMSHDKAYILSHAIEYHVREDCIYCIEENCDDPDFIGLTEDKVLDMLDTENLLDELYAGWELKYYEDSAYMDRISGLIEDCV